MQKILYTMYFRGRISSTSTDKNSLRTTSSATSCIVSTTVRPSGVNTELHASEGDLAFMESELRLTGPDSFQEDGIITFGDDNEHVLRFSTLGQGHFTQSPEPGILAGVASWKIEGGKGQFAAACGFITSHFALSDSGELSEFHCGRIFLPEEMPRDTGAYAEEACRE